MKPLLLAVCLLLVWTGARAALRVWQPSAGHAQVPIWPGTPPDQPSFPGPEFEQVGTRLYGGKTITGAANVSRPTLTVYAPRGTSTGAAVIVFPGGGFQGLAMNLEGTEPCEWLTSIGMTCVLLKYRVPSTPYDWRCKCYPDGPDVVSTPSLQDAQRTIRLVRYHAAQWHLNPNHIGVTGFSAGGYLVGEVSADFNRQSYKPIDAADRESDRPDFALAIYPGHMVTHHDGIATGHLNPNIHFSRETPPTFIVQAEDDPEDSIFSSLSYYIGLVKAHVPAELHIYPDGGHAFGLRPTAAPITHWPLLADAWLHRIGMLPAVPRGCADGAALADNCLAGFGTHH